MIDREAVGGDARLTVQRVVAVRSCKQRVIGRRCTPRSLTAVGCPTQCARVHPPPQLTARFGAPPPPNSVRAVTTVKLKIPGVHLASSPSSLACILWVVFLSQQLSVPRLDQEQWLPPFRATSSSSPSSRRERRASPTVCFENADCNVKFLPSD